MRALVHAELEKQTETLRQEIAEPLQRLLQAIQLVIPLSGAGAHGAARLRGPVNEVAAILGPPPGDVEAGDVKAGALEARVRGAEGSEDLEYVEEALAEMGVT